MNKILTSLNKNKGFTLLELLVVISIIGVLVSLGAVSYSTAQKKGRDAKRKSDLKSIQNGFEQYYSLENSYPASCVVILSVTPAILPGGYPNDPKANENYLTVTPAPSCTDSTYCFRTILETGSGGNCSTGCNTNGTTSFCVSNLQ